MFGAAGLSWLTANSDHVQALEGAEASQPQAQSIKTLPGGLRYTDFMEGSGPAPEWGNMLRIQYTTYVIENGKDLKVIDSSKNRNDYLFRHGNGFQIQGMEEAVHTMKLGGYRRVIIPPHMSYVSSDLGPLPDSAGTRRNMNRAINDVSTGGLLVMDIQLLKIESVPDPKRYYTDITDPVEIRKRLSQKN